MGLGDDSAQPPSPVPPCRQPHGLHVKDLPLSDWYPEVDTVERHQVDMSASKLRCASRIPRLRKCRSCRSTIRRVSGAASLTWKLNASSARNLPSKLLQHSSHGAGPLLLVRFVCCDAGSQFWLKEPKCTPPVKYTDGWVAVFQCLNELRGSVW